MKRSALPSALLLLTLTLSACGEDDTASSATTMPAPTTTASTTTAPTTTAPTTTAPTTTAATTTSVATPDTTSPVSTDAPPASTADPSDEAAEVCAVAEEINSSDAMPTLEQIERYLAVAPPDLQPAVETVLEKVTAADGDFSVIFADPNAMAAIEQISAFEATVCGIGELSDQDPSVTQIDENATRIDVVATEYAFEATLPTEAGRYSFVMQNDGEEPHIMILVRLEDGVALEDVLASEGDEGVAEEFESSAAGPGGEGVLTADLGPGNWVLLCPIPGPEGHPHFVDGMINEFTISP